MNRIKTCSTIVSGRRKIRQLSSWAIQHKMLFACEPLSGGRWEFWMRLENHQALKARLDELNGKLSDTSDRGVAQ